MELPIGGKEVALRNKMRACSRERNKAQKLNKRFRLLIGETAVDSILEHGWEPRKEVIRMYGWVFAWLYPLNSLMNSYLNEPLTLNMRNQIQYTVSAIFSLIAVEGKYGVKLPHDPRHMT